MADAPTSSYDYAEVQDMMDQHLDMETAMLRVELQESEAVRKLVHHLKLAINQISDMVGKLPEYVTKQDGSLETLVSSGDVETLNKVVKQLNVLELPDITPELERDIFVYVVAHNYVNSYAKWRNVTIDSFFGQVLALHGVLVGRAVSQLYWKYNRSEHVVDLIGEHGYSWTFIDPNSEVAKLREEDNLTAQQARAKLMQRLIDLINDPTPYPHSRWPDHPSPFVGYLWVLTNRGARPGLEEFPEGDDLHKIIAKADPSRYLIETETEEEDA